MTSNYQHDIHTLIAPLLEVYNNAQNNVATLDITTLKTTLAAFISHDLEKDIHSLTVVQQFSSDNLRRALHDLIHVYNNSQGHHALLSTPAFPTKYASIIGESVDSILSVVQFNMLADNLSGADPKLGSFVGPPPECLAWEYRKWRIVEYLLREDADVICMQEVDMPHYLDFFRPLFAHLGYSSIFKAKLKPTAVHSDTRDGCIILSRLPIMETWGWRLSETENQVAVGGVIAAENIEVMVVATHLKSAKSAIGEDIRQRQAGMLMSHIEQVVKVRELPVIVCADLNASYCQTESCPYEARAYPVITSNPTPRMFSTYCAYGDHALVDGVCVEEGTGEAPYTTCKTRGKALVKHTIDFIFASQGVHPVKLTGIPQGDTLPECGLPAWSWPSDHLPLHAWLALPTKGSKRTHAL